MKNLSDVSETAIITLRSRVIESKRENPIIEDPIGEKCLERIKPLLSKEVYNRVINRKISDASARYITLRSRKYDDYTKIFIKNNPRGLTVNLGCGLDTRYWRVSNNPWNYAEIDLPKVIEFKKKILGDIIDYKIIGISVLDDSWINKIADIQKEKILFLAEGLFMYLPEPQVSKIFQKISEIFSKSQIVFETVNEKYTKGFRKRMVEKKMKKMIGTAAGSAYSFGLRKAKDIEKYGKNIKVVEEWSYFEDKDIKPYFFRFFRFFKIFTRVQWTIKALIN